MNGWVVHDHAEVLKDDWHTTWPSSVAARNQSGHYALLDEMDSDARVAEWQEHGKP
jgi:hypothetical protein